MYSMKLNWNFQSGGGGGGGGQGGGGPQKKSLPWGRYMYGYFQVHTYRDAQARAALHDLPEALCTTAHDGIE